MSELLKSLGASPETLMGLAGSGRPHSLHLVHPIAEIILLGNYLGRGMDVEASL